MRRVYPAVMGGNTPTTSSLATATSLPMRETSLVILWVDMGVPLHWIAASGGRLGMVYTQALCMRFQIEDGVLLPDMVSKQ